MFQGIFDELNRREFIKKMALTGAAAYLGFDCDIAKTQPEFQWYQLKAKHRFYGFTHLGFEAKL